MQLVTDDIAFSANHSGDMLIEFRSTQVKNFVLYALDLGGVILPEHELMSFRDQFSEATIETCFVDQAEHVSFTIAHNRLSPNEVKLNTQRNYYVPMGASASQAFGLTPPLRRR